MKKLFIIPLLMSLSLIIISCSNKEALEKEDNSPVATESESVVSNDEKEVVGEVLKWDNLSIPIPEGWILSPENHGYTIVIDDDNSITVNLDIYYIDEQEEFFKRKLKLYSSSTKRDTTVSNIISFHGRDALEVYGVDAYKVGAHRYTLSFVERETNISFSFYSKANYDETIVKVKSFFDSAKFK